MKNKFQRGLVRVMHALGLSVFVPVAKLAFGDAPRKQIDQILRHIAVPVAAFAIFIGIWAWAAPRIKSDAYGQLPSPTVVVKQSKVLLNSWFENREKEKAFYAAQKEKADKYLTEAKKFEEEAKTAADPDEKDTLTRKAETRRKRADNTLDSKYAASPTYIDQIVTSIKTVFIGFVISALVAIPIGILCGLSPTFMSGVTPFIAIFKPVSPLAWLPLVTITVAATYTTAAKDAWFEKSFLISAITVALCSLWPTLINTALGVASIDKDHLNVARVLQLGTWDRVFKIILPSSLPLIFTGLRLSLGVGWMVLIAAEMLAQNPGLGKFVWDMFQNGNEATLANIIVAVFTIGVIGFLLDRVMVVLQKAVSFDAAAAH